MRSTDLKEAQFLFMTRDTTCTVRWVALGAGYLKGFYHKAIYKVEVQKNRKNSVFQTGLLPNKANSLFFINSTK